MTIKCNSGHQNWVYLSHSILYQTNTRVQNSYLVTRIAFTCQTLYYNKQIPEFKTTIWSPVLYLLVILYITPRRFMSSKQLTGHQNCIYLSHSVLHQTDSGVQNNYLVTSGDHNSLIAQRSKHDLRMDLWNFNLWWMIINQNKLS